MDQLAQHLEARVPEFSRKRNLGAILGEHEALSSPHRLFGDG
jgi:hypothetical protein